MVIHDMRNPTNSIEFAIKEVLGIVFQFDPTQENDIFFNTSNENDT